MKRIIVLLTIIIGLVSTDTSVYKLGDSVADFTLKNIDDKMVSLSDYKDKKGAIVIFTCNHCPYAKAYEDRIIAINNKYKDNYPVLAINPNDPVAYPSDSFKEMKKRAKEKGFTFPYLIDETQKIAKDYGALKTPHVYLLKNDNGTFKIKYIGAIDNNYKDPKEVTKRYLEDAIKDLESGNEVQTAQTIAIGCSIKWK